MSKIEIRPSAIYALLMVIPLLLGGLVFLGVAWWLMMPAFLLPFAILYRGLVSLYQNPDDPV